ncbi:DedA family protein [Ornithinimicrobium faecis]|uniref:DedA family protein n=1 Tax=Ornithinimicrobium faecis TaxID=2934158 RepID=A0ABY4YSL4_9MICO|nr:DedA family protein [Ornithinimicrobium sp. HY1793]USQ79766.1 DedA family protein [Ornithinimicrobium sp. HY1793]
MVEAINEFVSTHADSQWVLWVVFALCIVDGFFPPLPSESIVVGLAAAAVAVGHPNLWLVFLAAAVGAFIGDNIAYTIGRHWLTGLADSPRPRIRRTMAWAAGQLERRGAVIIMAARYIPVGRVAVNITAGATRFPRWLFVVLDAVAAISWAAYSIAIGTLAGQWLHDNPLLAMAVAVTGGVLLGLLLERLLKLFTGSPHGADFPHDRTEENA